MYYIIMVAAITMLPCAAYSIRDFVHIDGGALCYLECGTPYLRFHVIASRRSPDCDSVRFRRTLSSVSIPEEDNYEIASGVPPFLVPLTMTRGYLPRSDETEGNIRHLLRP